MTNSRQQLEGSSDPDGFVWKPTRTLAECDAMITQPGQLLQTELAFVDGRVMKVYKNLWPVCIERISSRGLQHTPVFCLVDIPVNLDEALFFCS